MSRNKDTNAPKHHRLWSSSVIQDRHCDSVGPKRKSYKHVGLEGRYLPGFKAGHLVLREDLRIMFGWSHDWQVLFNLEKR